MRHLILQSAFIASIFSAHAMAAAQLGPVTGIQCSDRSHFDALSTSIHDAGSGFASIEISGFETGVILENLKIKLPEGSYPESIRLHVGNCLLSSVAEGLAQCEQVDANQPVIAYIYGQTPEGHFGQIAEVPLVAFAFEYKLAETLSLPRASGSSRLDEPRKTRSLQLDLQLATALASTVATRSYPTNGPFTTCQVTRSIGE